jgi:hypothetical protein
MTTVRMLPPPPPHPIVSEPGIVGRKQTGCLLCLFISDRVSRADCKASNVMTMKWKGAE